MTRRDYDMLGLRIHETGMDTGEHWSLHDAFGMPLYRWDSRGHVLRTTYDALRRPTGLHLIAHCQPTALVQRTIYGESVAHAAASNLRNQVYQLFDGAGVVTSSRYDFKGNLLKQSRRLAMEYKSAPDWSADVALDPEIYTKHTTYDALNRPVTLTMPDGSVIRSTYNEANLLDRVEAHVQGCPNATTFVKNIGYDARGQRESIEYGNGARTQYTYDPLTFRLIHLYTGRDGATVDAVQDLRYTYDPVGNITYVSDRAQQTLYFRNRTVEPSSSYTYDAIYRLIEATGREHLGQVDQVPVPTTPRDAPRIELPHPGDGKAMGRYVQRYVYDAVGNILAMSHRGTTPAQPGWTRHYAYEEPSLLEPWVSNNRLSSTRTGRGCPGAYTYDAHGNMTTMPHLPVMRWDYADRLAATTVQSPDHRASETTYYVYDAAGLRIRKVTEHQTTQEQPKRKDERIYLGGFEIYRRYRGDGCTVKLERETLHVRDDRSIIALLERRTQGDDKSPRQVTRYQLDNHLGSVCVELDDAAQIISYEEYYLFGSTAYQAGRCELEVARKRYRYIARERDEETGLYHMGARYYAPWLGRWIAPDPAGFADGLAQYSYARNNPVRWNDPGGMVAGNPDEPHVVEPTPEEEAAGMSFYAGMSVSPESTSTSEQAMAAAEQRRQAEVGLVPPTEEELQEEAAAEERPALDAELSAPTEDEPGLLAQAIQYVRESDTAQFIMGLGTGGLAGAAPGGFTVGVAGEASGASENFPRSFRMGYGLGEAAWGVAQVIAGGIGEVAGGLLVVGGGAATTTGGGSSTWCCRYSRRHPHHFRLYSRYRRGCCRRGHGYRRLHVGVR
ncbi:MAG: RHS repeat-associated core domain-containing protein [Deltaproteobacteria bacterium]|nr:RHS repeat-associated core domain-containing protein [Deltaproteobacteria bacterium]